MYERILVPTDGSDVAGVAAEAAITFARRFDAELHAVHVLEMGDLPPGVEDEDADQFATRGNEALSTIGETASDNGVEATTTVVESDEPVHRALLTYADEHDVDCIVMGTHGRTGLDRFVLGSIVARTLRESPVPVMTVHEETVLEPDLDAVLVPTDGSACAEAAVDHGIELALATDATLHVVNVVNPRLMWDEYDSGDILEALGEAGEQALQAVGDQAAESGVKATQSSVLRGVPYRSIIEYADQRDVDCIVMGTHGRTGVDRYLLGSVTERVVRLSDVPVLAVKDQESAD